MAFYSIVLFLHILGALGLFASLALEWAALANLRRAESMTQLREWAGLFRAMRNVGGPSALTLVATGIYMGATRWQEQAWVGLALLGLVLLVVLGAVLSVRRYGAINRDARREGLALPPDLRRRLQAPVLLVSAWLRTGLAFGIVYLMAAKPGPATAIAVLGAGTAVGLAIGLAAAARRTPLAPESDSAGS